MNSTNLIVADNVRHVMAVLASEFFGTKGAFVLYEPDVKIIKRLLGIK